MTKYNTEFTDNPICPHCGYKMKDAWEFDFGPGLEGDVTTQCDDCGKEIWITRHCSVSYSTEKR